MATMLGRADSYVDAIVSELRRDAVLFAAIVIYSALALAYAIGGNRVEETAHSTYIEQWVGNFLIIMPVITLFLGFARIVLKLNSRRVLAIRQMFGSRRVGRFLAGLTLMMALMIFQGNFTTIKMALSAGAGFPYDHALADFDKWLHLGRDPWVYLHGLLGAGVVLDAIEFNYNVVWFIINFFLLFWVVTSPKASEIRVRYILGFMVVWILLGNILAGWFLSAGPAYYGYVTGDTARFSDLLAYLSENAGTSSSAATYQAYLWQAYVSEEAKLGSGISAFPSVHVGLVMFNALYAYEYKRWLGNIASLYVVLILASSVYLGWHYAIDGYASILIVYSIYRISKSYRLSQQSSAVGMGVRARETVS